MTKYVSRPRSCTAFKITEIRGCWANGNVALTLENGMHVEALPDMLARFPGNQPRVGWYWVISDVDGYVYINPTDVFERNWESFDEANYRHQAQAHHDVIGQQINPAEIDRINQKMGLNAASRSALQNNVEGMSLQAQLAKEMNADYGAQPPVDNDHVAEGCEKFDQATIDANRGRTLPAELVAAANQEASQSELPENPLPVTATPASNTAFTELDTAGGGVDPVSESSSAESTLQNAKAPDLGPRFKDQDTQGSAA